MDTPQTYSSEQMADDLTVALCTFDVMQRQGRLSPKLSDLVRQAKGRLGKLSRYLVRR